MRIGIVLIFLCLLECVVDGRRETRIAGDPHSREHSADSTLEESAGLVFTTVTKRVRNEFFAFRDEYGSEQLGMHINQRASQPNVEEVGQVRVKYVVVVRWVSADQGPRIPNLTIIRIALQNSSVCNFQ